MIFVAPVIAHHDIINANDFILLNVFLDINIIVIIA